MATAITIRNMHSAADGEGSSGRKLKAMLYAFGAAMALRIVSQYALGLLWVGEKHKVSQTASEAIFPFNSFNVTDFCFPKGLAHLHLVRRCKRCS